MAPVVQLRTREPITALHRVGAEPAMLNGSTVVHQMEHLAVGAVRALGDQIIMGVLFQVLGVRDLKAADAVAAAEGDVSVAAAMSEFGAVGEVPQVGAAVA
jgi:hypothetical protein